MHSRNIFIKHSIDILYVAIGAVFGGVVGSSVDNIIISNSIGSYLIGMSMGLSLQGRAKLLLNVGLCGSITTFSGWIYRFFLLLKDGFFFDAFLYILFILIIGIIFVFLGFFSGRKFNLLTHFQ